MKLFSIFKKSKKVTELKKEFEPRVITLKDEDELPFRKLYDIFIKDKTKVNHYMIWDFLRRKYPIMETGEWEVNFKNAYTTQIVEIEE